MVRRAMVIWLGGWSVGFVTLATVLGAVLTNPFLWPMALVGAGLYGLIGLGIVAVALHHTTRKIWISAAGVAAAAVGFLLAFAALVGLGDDLDAWVRFRLARPVYDEAVRLTDAGLYPRGGNLRGVAFEVEPGPPQRVAFPLPEGVADNWSAVIYDPSDRVATARGWGTPGGDDLLSPDLKELFGGDLFYCRRLEDHYYRCSFT